MQRRWTTSRKGKKGGILFTKWQSNEIAAEGSDVVYEVVSSGDDDVWKKV